ncbi:MAG: sigma 54-interacting transcriptional regulator [Calditrichae bacterium]|nr:sigma 54-interacting transcriptional regulator [Calditrichia bacterium]
MRIPHTSTAVAERDPRLQKRGNPVMNETPNPVRHRSELFAAIVGDSAAIAAVKDLTARIMSRKWRYVMISGEPGTGKEMLARALHTHSFREFRPFVECRCSEFASEDVEKLLLASKQHQRKTATEDCWKAPKTAHCLSKKLANSAFPFREIAQGS